MVLYDSSWQDCPDTGSSTGAYFLFYQYIPIDHCTHVPGTVDQYSAESEYNTTCTSEMYLKRFRMLNNELWNTDLDVLPKQKPLIILKRKSGIFMSRNGKDTKHTRNISRIMHSVENGE